MNLHDTHNKSVYERVVAYYGTSRTVRPLTNGCIRTGTTATPICEAYWDAFIPEGTIRTEDPFDLLTVARRRIAQRTTCSAPDTCQTNHRHP